jgi:hypothetical protein
MVDLAKITMQRCIVCSCDHLADQHPIGMDIAHQLSLFATWADLFP